MYDIADLVVGSGVGLAPYGIRHAGDSVKAKGFFGLLSNPEGGKSTEISSEDDKGEFPLLAPTLTRDEVNHLLSGAEPTDDIYRKAIQWANFRRNQGMSPFASQTELRSPVGLLD